MNGAATEAIGYKKSTKSEWLSKDTWNTIEERKQLKKNFLAAKSPRLKERAAALYREKDKEVKKSARKDKRIYTDKLAERAQRAAEMKDMKTVYQIDQGGFLISYFHLSTPPYLEVFQNFLLKTLTHHIPSLFY